MAEKIYGVVEAHILEDIKASDISPFMENEDVAFMGCTLCHEGMNDKGDRFTREELRKSWKTILYKPTNWEHSEPNIGTAIDSTLYIPENNKGKAKIDVISVLWRYKYPQYVELVRKAGVEGTLKVSMEALFTDADYAIGELEQIIPEAEATEEIKNLKGKKAEQFGGKFVSRILKNIIFCGLGITALPADKNAAIWAFASDMSLYEYHAYLHDVFEGKVRSMMSPSQLIEEHRRIHQKMIENSLYT